MDVLVQRYPKDSRQEDAPGADMTYARFMIWKWVASVVLTCGLVLPLLELAAQSVRERQMRMKDLLEISGLLSTAYWSGYVLAGLIVTEIALWIFDLILLAGTILTTYHVAPYAGLMTTYGLALIAFLLAFGFVVFRVEYYGLPAFLVTVAFAVCGDYVADAYDLTIGFKCKSSHLSLLCTNSCYVQCS